MVTITGRAWDMQFGDELHESGRTLDGVRAAKLQHGEETRSAAASEGYGVSCAAGIAVRGASPLREDLVRPRGREGGNEERRLPAAFKI